MTDQIKIIELASVKPAADFIANRIREELEARHRVLWLVSGGSAIEVAVTAAEAIAKYHHHDLAVMLADERYGSPGHGDSNWQQLQTAGFKLPAARLIPVLAGYDFPETVRVFSFNLKRESARADYIIGLFGIGADGHTAGILPHSSAVDCPELACTYEANDFRRLTITPNFFPLIDEAILFAQGEAKLPRLEKLNQAMKIAEQPAQALKKAKHLSIYYLKK